MELNSWHDIDLFFEDLVLEIKSRPNEVIDVVHDANWVLVKVTHAFIGEKADYTKGSIFLEGRRKIFHRRPNVCATNIGGKAIEGY